MTPSCASYAPYCPKTVCFVASEMLFLKMRRLTPPSQQEARLAYTIVSGIDELLCNVLAVRHSEAEYSLIGKIPAFWPRMTRKGHGSRGQGQAPRQSVHTRQSWGILYGTPVDL